MVGKDILRFHAVYWPAFLMAAGYELPKKVFAHGWWTVEGEKISKSLGNAISPLDLIEEFGLDYVRYFLMREKPIGNDGNFSRELSIQRINAELCNNIGNLAQRTLSFVYKNCDGKIPSNANLQADDQKLLDAAYSVLDKMRLFIDEQAINNAFEEVVKLGSLANEYIDHQAPWTLKNTDQDRMQAVLYTLLECIRVIAILLQPLIPDAAARLLELLAVKETTFASLNKAGQLKPGTVLPEPKVIFPRIVV
jgi:methionyl-tRNA synthetase